YELSALLQCHTGLPATMLCTMMGLDFGNSGNMSPQIECFLLWTVWRPLSQTHLAAIYLSD
ncbi:hypothetical protein STEG23_035047, partial [Scotinomys teguina]